MKALRRLGAVEARAVPRTGDLSIGAVPERVGHGQGRGRAGAGVERGDHPVDDRLWQAGARDIVDQDETWGIGGQAPPTRTAPRRRGWHRPAVTLMPGGGANVAMSSGVEREHDPVHPWCGLKPGQRPVDHPPPGQRAPLLGRAGAGTGAAASGNDEGRQSS